MVNDGKKKTVKGRKKPARPSKSQVQSTQDGIALNFKPFGPDQTVLNTLARDLIQHPALQPVLKKTRYRLLSVELIDPEPEVKTSRTPASSDRFKATIYDYTNNRSITAAGNLASLRRLDVSESSRQPLPSQEEFDEAVKILMKGPGIGVALREQRLRPYPPMPPLIEVPQPDGRIERTLAVGLLPTNHAAPHEIV